MRIHHLRCGTMCPVGGRLMDGTSDSVAAHLVCHTLLIETNQGLVLIDTGFGTKDVRWPSRRLPALFRLTNNIQLRPEETALAHVRRLGFRAEDVRHIVLSHLDFDHAGGIEDFPDAVVHVTAREKEAADARNGGGFIGRERYRPSQWDQVVDWRLYPWGRGEPWFGFDAVRQLDGLPPEILLIPLAGHTRGHSGIAIREDGDGWLLYAGDAYFYRGEMGAAQRVCPPLAAGYQRVMEVDRRARLTNQAKLRALSLDHAGEVRVFCAHDPVELAILSGDTQ